MSAGALLLDLRTEIMSHTPLRGPNNNVLQRFTECELKKALEIDLLEFSCFIKSKEKKNLDASVRKIKQWLKKSLWEECLNFQGHQTHCV